MRLDEGSDTLNSYMGSLWSLILFLLVVMYSYLKADVLINKKDVDVLSTINDRFFTPDDAINLVDDGFNIAAAFSAFNSDPEPTLDPSYGELLFLHYFWGVQENGEYAAGRRILESTHNCTKDELGLGQDSSDSKFFPTYEQNQDIINIH